MQSEWRSELGIAGAFIKKRTFTSGVAIHDRYPILALVDADQNLRVIHRFSGRTLWREPFGAVGIGVPFMIDDLLYLPTDDGRLSAYNLKTRKVVWRRQFSGLIDSPITHHENKLYFTDGGSHLYAIDAREGKILWQHTHRSREDQSTPTSYQSVAHQFSLHGSMSPYIHQDKVFVGYSDGMIRALDAQSGQELWVRDLARQVSSFQDVDADFAVIGNTLYAASAASGLYALSLDQGEVRWFHPLAGIISLTAYQDSLILGLQYGEVGRFDPQDRAFMWRISVDADGVPQRVLKFPHGLAFTLTRGGLYVLNANTGELRDQFSSGSGLQSALALSTDGWLYTTSLSGFLYAFSPRGQ
jgi:outer membrane protein assembly factor BamB